MQARKAGAEKNGRQRPKSLHSAKADPLYSDQQANRADGGQATDTHKPERTSQLSRRSRPASTDFLSPDTAVSDSGFPASQLKRPVSHEHLSTLQRPVRSLSSRQLSVQSPGGQSPARRPRGLKLLRALSLQDRLDRHREKRQARNLSAGSATDSSMKHGQMSPTNFPTTPDKTMSHVGTPEPSVSNSSIKHSKRESYKAQKRTYRSQKKEAAKELLSTITDPAVVLLGDWLKVRGTLKSWTKLWCVLKPGVLILYKSDKHKGSQWVGTILLNTCQLLERPSKKDGFCFKLFHPLDQSIWATKGPKGEQIGAFVQPLPYSYCIFRAPSESAGKCWMDALELALKCTNLLKRSMTRLDNTADTAADLDLIERSRNQDAPWRPPSQGEDEHVSHNGSDHLHDVEGEVFSHSFNSMRAQERSMNESDLERHFANQGSLTCRAVEKAAAKERDSELQSAKSVESADGAHPARERNIDRRSRYSPPPRRSDTSQSPPPFIVSKTILRSPAIVKPVYARARSAPLPRKRSLLDSAFSQASQQTEDSKRCVDQDTELWIQPHSDSQAEQGSKGSTVTPSGLPPSIQPPFVYSVSGEVEDISLSDSTVASKLRVKPLGPLDVAGSKGPPGAAGLKGPDGQPAQWLVKGADIVWTDDGCVQICEASHTSVDSGGRDPASAWLLVVSGHHTPTDTERTSSGSQLRSLHPLSDTTSRDSSNRSAHIGYDGDVSGINSATYSGTSGQPTGLGREREDRAAGATMWEVSWDGAQSPSASSSSRKVGSRVRSEYHKQCMQEGRVVSPRTVRSSSPTSTRTSPRSSPTKWDAETEPGEVTASARSRLVDKARCPPGSVLSPSARSRVETDVDRGRPIGSRLSPSARSRFGWGRSVTGDGTASSEASSSHITSVSSLPRSQANADRGSDSSLHTHTDSGPRQGVNFGVSGHTPTRRGDKHLTFEGTDQEFERGSFTSEWPTDAETLIGDIAPLPSILKIRFSEDTATEDTETQTSSSARLTVTDTHTTPTSENTGSGMRSSKTSSWETETETPTGSSSRKPTASDTQSEQTDTQSEQTTEVSTPTGSSSKRQTGSEATSTETTPTGSTNKRQTGSETQSSLTSTWGTHTDTALSTEGKSVETQNSQQSRDTLSPADRPGSTSDSLTSTDARTDPSSASSAYEVRSRASIANSANQAGSRVSSASSANEVRSQASSASSANEAKSRASNASSANEAKSRASSASSANEVRFRASTASSTKEAKSGASSASSADEVRSQASSASSANEVRFRASTTSSTKEAKSRASSASSANKLRSQASKVKSANEVRSQASKVKSANEVRSQASSKSSTSSVKKRASSASSTSEDSSEDSSDSSLPVSKVSNDSCLPMSKVSNALDHNVSAKGSWSNTPAHSALDHNVSAKGSWSNRSAHSALDHNVSAKGSWSSLSMSASPSRSRISSGTSGDTSLSSGRLYRHAPGSSHRNKKEGGGKGGGGGKKKKEKGDDGGEKKEKKKKDKGDDDGGEKKKKKKDKDGEKAEEGAAEGEGGDKKKKKSKKKKDKDGFLDEPPAEGAGEDPDKKKKKSKKKKDKDKEGGEGKEGEAAPAAGEGAAPDAEGGEAGEEGGKKKKKKKDKKKGEEGADPAASGGDKAEPGAEGGEDGKKKDKKKKKDKEGEGEKPEGEKSGDAAAEGGDDKKKKKSKKKKKEEGGEGPKAEGETPAGDAAGDEGGKKKKKKKKGKDEDGATSGDDHKKEGDPTTSQGEATNIPQGEVIVIPPPPVAEAKPEESAGDGQGVNIEALSGAKGQAADAMPSSSGTEMSDPGQAGLANVVPSGESASPSSGKSDGCSFGSPSRKTSTSENEDHVFDLPYGYDKEATWKDTGQAPKLNKVCSKCVVALKREDPYGCLYMPDNQDTAETQRYKVMPVSDLRAEGASMTGLDDDKSDREDTELSSQSEFEDDVVTGEAVIAPPDETNYILQSKEEMGQTGDECQTEEVTDENKSLIWTLVKQVRPGMDLSKVVLPTFILEPRSFLDKLSDYYYHANILTQAVVEESPYSRIKSVVRWYLSGFYKKPKGLKKPYNPVIGEAFRCCWRHPETGARTFYIAEQVSHHPPISVFHITNRKDGFNISGSILARSKFYGNSLSALLEGVATLTFLERGEDYYITMPYAHCKGILIGTLTMELGGKVTIDCPKTGYKCEMDFKLKPFLGSGQASNRIHGKIMMGSDVLSVIDGHWDQEIYIKDRTLDKKRELFWSPTPDIRAGRLKRYTVPLTDQFPHESERLWSKVSKAVVAGDMQTATDEKYVVEEEQRKQTRERKQSNVEWMPRYFEKDHLNGGWIYKYADDRPWDPVNDVYQYEKQFVVQTQTRHKTPHVRAMSLTSLNKSVEKKKLRIPRTVEESDSSGQGHRRESDSSDYVGQRSSGKTIKLTQEGMMLLFDPLIKMQEETTQALRSLQQQVVRLELQHANSAGGGGGQGLLSKDWVTLAIILMFQIVLQWIFR